MTFPPKHDQARQFVSAAVQGDLSNFHRESKIRASKLQYWIPASKGSTGVLLPRQP